MTRPEWLTICSIAISVILCGLVVWQRQSQRAYVGRIERTNEGTRRSNELVRQSNDRRDDMDRQTQTDNAITREAIAEYLRARRPAGSVPATVCPQTADPDPRRRP